MTDLAQVQGDGPGRAAEDRSGSTPGRSAAGDSGRAAARAVLDAALSGVSLTATDRRFVTRLTHWDKRTATTVASLIARARQSGRQEAELSDERLELVLAALRDAVEFRASGAASARCWDCASLASGLCAEHAQDADRAREFARLAAHLGGQGTAADVKHAGLMLAELLS